MSKLSNYGESQVALWLAGGTPTSLPATLYLDIYSDLPSEAGVGGVSVCNTITGLARIAVLSSKFTALNDTVTNNSEILITNAAINGASIVGFAIWTALTNGSMIYYGNVQNSQIGVLSGETVKFLANAINITVD